MNKESSTLFSNFSGSVAGNVPAERLSACNSRPVNGSGNYVMYWMTAYRRRHYNFALQRAMHWATELRRPLLIVEALNSNYRWSSVRIHTPLLQGMLDNQRAFAGSAARYYPFVERFPSHGRGMMLELSSLASVVVTDDFPTQDITRWIATVAASSPVLVEKVDSNGILPMRSTDRVFSTAHSFRRFLQTRLPSHLAEFPMMDALAQVELPPAKLPASIQRRWPSITAAELSRLDTLVPTLPVDASLPSVPGFKGGSTAAREHLRRFTSQSMGTYADARNQPDADASSGISPYLHFGHLSAHEVFLAVTSQERWSPERLSSKADGRREGWWNMSANAEAFLDQLVVWREIGFNMCAGSSDYERYGSLPSWAKATLNKHASDPRPVLYSVDELEHAETEDSVWNSAQTQLIEEGRIHNYLRMLWGKKILEWSPSPQQALETMIRLNNRYALDGRDPNSYTGIFWILGRYDRPWAPERPIFGTVRYMSSANTVRKLHVREYVQRYAQRSLL